MVKKTIAVPIFVWGCSKQTPSCSTMYHITIASKHKRRKLWLVGASVRHIRVSPTCRNNGCCASGNFLPVRRLFPLCYATRLFLLVNGSKSTIRCILRSVSKPTLVIFGTFEVGKAYRIDLILWSTEMYNHFRYVWSRKSLPYRPETLEYRDEQTVNASLLFLKFSVSQFIQSQNYWNFSEILICPN